MRAVLSVAAGPETLRILLLVLHNIAKQKAYHLVLLRYNGGSRHHLKHGFHLIRIHLHDMAVCAESAVLVSRVPVQRGLIFTQHHYHS